MNKIKESFQRFMRGRYGADYLSRDLVWVSIILLLVSSLTRIYAFWYVGVAVMIYAYWRMFSKNTMKRYEENRKYMNWKTPWTRKLKKTWKRIKDLPKYKYLRCPQCRTQMRVPRGKKAIVVTCPSCKHKFDAKS